LCDKNSWSSPKPEKHYFSGSEYHSGILFLKMVINTAVPKNNTEIDTPSDGKS
jgi:hypothetical protein